MKKFAQPLILAAPLAILAFTAPAQGQSAPVHAPELSLCPAAGTPIPPPPASADLQGQWDFLIDVAGTPSRGVLALGHIDGAYAGAASPEATNTVAVRRLTINGRDIQMAIASRSDGDVHFSGQLVGNGGLMCGTMIYHQGQRFRMVAVQRANSYVPRAR